MRALLILAVVAVVPACLPVPVYRVQRTARVPHAAAPLRTGEPLDGPVEVSVGASSIGDVRSPHLADHDASIEVPSTQMRGELRIRIFDGELVLIHDHAIDSTIRPLDTSQAPVEQGSIYSLGLGFRYSFRFPGMPGFSLGVGNDVLQWTIPYVEYRSCVENCEGVPTQQINRGVDNTYALTLSITPTYRVGPVAIFGGLYAAQHPTIIRKGTEYYAQDYDSDLDDGRYNFILHAGLEYRAGPISLDVTRAPVSYGPSFGLALAIRLPDSYIEPDRPPAPAAPVHFEADDRNY